MINLYHTGQRVRIATCASIDSGKIGTILSWQDIRTSEVQNKFPLKDRHNCIRKWVAILLDDGKVTAYPKRRLFPD